MKQGLARRPRHQAIDQAQQTLQQIEEAGEFPLNRALCDELKSGMEFVQQAVRLGALAAHAASEFVTLVNSVLVTLPRTCGKRFLFDAAVIGAIQHSWNSGGQRLSSIILPLYEAGDWEHGRVRIPTRKGGEDDSLSFINFPGGADLSAVELWDYAFLCHELGHNLLYYGEEAFVQAFVPLLERRAAELALAGVADKGQVRAKGQRVVSEIRQVWEPVQNHKDWTHEMMMDLIALWACGPAYIASFIYEASYAPKNPYQITQEHPPYALRAEALALASEELGWGAQSRLLEEQQVLWRGSAWKSHLTNKYSRLTDSKITSACVSNALGGCAKLNLPKCDARQLARVEETLRLGESPNFGTDLIIASWLMRKDSDEDSYRKWEHHTVEALLDRIMRQVKLSAQDS